MATRAGKAVVPFEGDYTKLQSGAKAALAGVSRDIGTHVEGAFTKISKTGVSVFEGIAGAASRSFTAVGRTGAVAFAAVEASFVGMLVHATTATARVNELNITLDAVAKANQLNAASLHEYAIAVRGQGIETAVAQETVARMARSQLDLSKATDLARVAQDAAVVSGQNSTETLANLLNGIQTQQIEVLRSSGIYVNATDAYEAYAKRMGIASKNLAQDLTPTQKQAAMLDAVLADGAKLYGVYAKAMESPSKVLRSFPRYFNDIAVAAGGPMQKAFGTLVFGVADLLKAVGDPVKGMLVDPKSGLHRFLQLVGEAADKAAKPIEIITGRLEGFVKGLKGKDVDDFLAKLKPFEPILLGIGAALSVEGLAHMPFIGGMLPKINPVIAGLGGLLVGSKQTRDSLLNLGQAIVGVIPDMEGMGSPLKRLQTRFSDAASQGIDAIAAAITRMKEPIQDAIGTIGMLTGGVFGLFLKMAADAGPVLGDLFGTLGKVGGGLADLAKPAMQIVGLLEQIALSALRAVTGALGDLGPVVFAGLNAVLRAVIPSLETVNRVFGWIADHGWVVDAILASIVARFAAMAAIGIANFAVGAASGLMKLTQIGAGAGLLNLGTKVLPNLAKLLGTGAAGAAGAAGTGATVAGGARAASLGIAGLASAAGLSTGALAGLATGIGILGVAAVGLALDVGGIRTAIKNTFSPESAGEIQEGLDAMSREIEKGAKPLAQAWYDALQPGGGGIQPGSLNEWAQGLEAMLKKTQERARQSTKETYQGMADDAAILAAGLKMPEYQPTRGYYEEIQDLKAQAIEILQQKDPLGHVYDDYMKGVISSDQATRLLADSGVAGAKAVVDELRKIETVKWDETMAAAAKSTVEAAQTGTVAWGAAITQIEGYMAGWRQAEGTSWAELASARTAALEGQAAEWQRRGQEGLTLEGQLRQSYIETGKAQGMNDEAAKRYADNQIANYEKLHPEVVAARDRLNEMAAALGLSVDEAKKYPADVIANLYATKEAARQAQEKVALLAQHLQDVAKSGSVNITVTATGKTGLQTKQEGGWAWGDVLVGEQGREILRLPRPGYVIPHDETERIMAGQAPAPAPAQKQVVNITQHITTVPMDPIEMARETGWYMRTAL